MMDDMLKKYGLTYEELTPEEKETLNVWVSSIKEGTLSVDKIREFISHMRDGVEQELTRFDSDGKQDLYLKARLRNLMLLEAFLTSPEKAKKQLDKMISNLSGEVG